MQKTPKTIKKGVCKYYFTFIKVRFKKKTKLLIKEIKKALPQMTFEIYVHITQEY